MRPNQIVLGILLSSLIGLAGYQAKALSVSGVFGAILVGTAILGFGGWTWGLLLIIFFTSSSLLSRYREPQKEHLAERFAKSARRDLGQALANGGVGALLAAWYAFRQESILFVAFAGAIAAATADTWATEIGVLSPRPPRLITTGRTVTAGTSGGVTAMGLTAAFLGAATIGLSALLLRTAEIALASAMPDPEPIRLLIITPMAGVAAAVFDSYLGATVQAIYYCEACQKETEQPIHRCGTPTRQIRGWSWLNNDWVNFLATAFGAGAAIIGYWGVG